MYTPQNSRIFTAAFAGALAGMGVSDRVPTDSLPANYTGLVSVAGAFAQEFDTLWGLAPAASLQIQTVQSSCEAAWQDRAPQASIGNLIPATYQKVCAAIIAMIQAGLAYYAGNAIPNPPFGGGGGGGFPLLPLAVNSAGVDLYPNGAMAILRTGSNANPAGAYNGGGVGNKALLGLTDLDMPISALISIEYKFTNQLGPGGPFFIPPGGATVTTPYVNLIIDFGGGDLRVCVVLDDSLAALITAAIGTYSNDGFNVLTYAWNSAMDILIVNSPPNPVPGGVIPSVTVGPSWPENAYSWAALLAANPLAKLVTAFPGNPVFFPLGDGGMPVGATVPSILIVSGDSGNVVKSGKTLIEVKVNGNAILL